MNEENIDDFHVYPSQMPQLRTMEMEILEKVDMNKP
jgi:hypothetical protein